MICYEKRSVVNHHVLTATANITVSEALSLMSYNHSNYLFIVTQNQTNTTSAGKLIGVFTLRDLVRLAANKIDLNSVTLYDVMSLKLVTITETESQDVFTALIKFRDHNICHLPVIDNEGDLIGVITPEGIREIIQPLDLLRQKRVSEIMSPDVICASLHTSILELTQVMAQRQVSCVVIVEERQLQVQDKVAYIPLGIVTEQDIIEFCNQKLDLANTKASSIVLSTLVLKVKYFDSMWTANQLMQKRQVQHLVVTDDNNCLVGVITQTQILEAMNCVELLQTLETLQDIVEEQTSELKQLNEQLQREVNHRKLYEAKLRSSEEQMRALFEAMSDIILTIDINDSKVGTVQILPTYYGYEEQVKIDLASETVECFYQQQTAPLWLEKVTEALRKQQVVNFDYSLHDNNSEKWFSANISPIAENKVLWVARDISKHKFLEVALQISETQERQKAQQLEVALRELKRAEVKLILDEKMASLGRMVGGIAHEINNPNNFIYANIQPANEYSQQLLNLVNLYQHHYPQPVSEITQQQAAIDLEYISQDFPKLLGSIQEGAERIRKIVKLLQAFSSTDSPKYKKINIHESLDSAIQLLQHRLKGQSHRPAIQIIKEYKLKTSVECYPGQITQVFISIIANAIDAIEESIKNSNKYSYAYIRIFTQVVNSNAVITISNNGATIKPEIIAKIFDPFFTTKAPGQGTGLGLSICYKIISETHRGQISCHSFENQHTEFVISLPTQHLM
ncbi:two-component sensor histidine kinase [Calothrix sp. NIES-4071]|nr:two-component sensor histidine kinase [Calothrix sp. NIES-4071]BAZ62126.1 two-component sensor histidine kinase [Calothrix sp. NIES-4105]